MLVQCGLEAVVPHVVSGFLERVEALTKRCDEMLQSAPSGRSTQQLPARLDKPMVVGHLLYARTHDVSQGR